MHRHILALILALALPIAHAETVRTTDLAINAQVYISTDYTGEQTAHLVWSHPHNGRTATRHTVYVGSNRDGWQEIGTVSSPSRSFRVMDHQPGDQYLVAPSTDGYGYPAAEWPPR